VNMLVLTLWTC